MYHGTEFELGDTLPDGSDPADLVMLLGPWVQDCIRLMDGDGAFMHWKYPGYYAEQPAFDLDMLDIVRAEWNRLRTQDQERKWRETRSQ